MSMPSNTNEHYTWQQVARDVISLIQILALAYIASLGTRNNEKIVQVEEGQERVADRAKEVKQTLEIREEKDSQAMEIQLWSTWKYLESVAQSSDSQMDKNKAIEAKKTYDDFVRMNREKEESKK